MLQIVYQRKQAYSPVARSRLQASCWLRDEAVSLPTQENGG